MKLTGVLLGVWLLLSSPPVNAESIQPTPVEPQFLVVDMNVADWKLHFSLGIVIETVEGLWYSFHILNQYPVKECQEVRVVGNELYLMNYGIRYVGSAIPMLLRKPPNDWVMYERKTDR